MFSDFKKSTPSEFEEKILNWWEEKRIFEKSLERRKNSRPFSFYDGPPFATGLPHYGHILASTIKDLVPRYQTMRGRFVRRRWGWDCHGLPIEEVVERQLGISGKKQIEEIGIEKFNETCRSRVLEYVSEWKKTVRRIARWVDFDNSYKTMDRDYMESVWWAFKEIYNKKLVYEGRKVLLYCPRCETPISNFEVAMDNSYQDVTEEAVTVKFKLKIKPEELKGSSFETADISILAWTTTPWTLPGNVALAINPDLEYVAVPTYRYGPARYYILEKNSLERLKKEIPELNYSHAPQKIKASFLLGRFYEPLFNVSAVKSDKTFKIYAADFVTTDEGTGVVHTAVVYGEDDYNLGVKEGLPIVPMLDEKGIFNSKAPEFLQGQYFKSAEKEIKDDLERRGLILRREKHTHSYPHCWRCGTPLFYNAIPAWFINIQKIKSKLLSSNNKEVNWFPAHLKHGRYKNSVKDAPDWNISRNRYWGNPIPIWKCGKCGKTEAIGSLEELRRRLPPPRNQYWFMRHGESETLIKDVIDAGQKKYHLTTMGRAQVKDAAQALKKEKIDFIIASDILRTAETAKIAAKILQVKKVVFDKRLREIFLPSLAGLKSREYRKLFPSYESRFGERPPQNGESLRDVRARTWSLLRDLEVKYKGKKILLVSHEYPLWMLVTAAEGWDEKKAIEEKKKREPGDFIKPAEFLELNFTAGPRNAGGEIDLHRPYIDAMVFKCGVCGGKSRRITEIFDSWVEAGSMPFAEYHYPFENKKTFLSRLPAQFVAEYIAQTRAWFYVMHVISVVLFGKAPFQNVVTTGTILAEDGSKMSKSKGNFPDPWTIINQYGADALRFYLMQSVVMQADNLNFSAKDLEIVNRKVVLILKNVYNFFEMYADETKSKEKIEKTVLDKWIEARTEQTILGVTEGFDNYDTVKATRVIAEYVDDLSTWYLRRSRKRKDPAFFATFRECLLKTSMVIAPVTPYMAEGLYLNLTGGGKSRRAESVHLIDWPKADKKRIDKKLIAAMAEVRRLASAALAKRAEAEVKVRQPLQKLEIRNWKLEISKSKELLEILKDEINVKEIAINKKLQTELLLDTRITPALREEGLLRELVRAVQGLRQEAHLLPKDAIALFIEGDKEIEQVALRHSEALRKEVGAKSLTLTPTSKFDAELDTKLNGGHLWIGIKKLQA